MGFGGGGLFGRGGYSGMGAYSIIYGYINCRFKETIKVLDAKQSMYIFRGNKLKARV